jgi:hypothetical protein
MLDFNIFCNHMYSLGLRLYQDLQIGIDHGKLRYYSPYRAAFVRVPVRDFTPTDQIKANSGKTLHKINKIAKQSKIFGQQMIGLPAVHR